MRQDLFHLLQTSFTEVEVHLESLSPHLHGFVGEGEHHGSNVFLFHLLSRKMAAYTPKRQLCILRTGLAAPASWQHSNIKNPKETLWPASHRKNRRNLLARAARLISRSITILTT